MIKRIVVNKHIIRKNKKEGAAQPPLSVRTSRGVIRANNISGAEFELVYRPEKPLSCGATVWIETKAPLMIDGREVMP